MAAVDVIIPAYNAAKYLPQALDSLLAQTFTDWQAVLVDDGSTDNTHDIAVRYQILFGPKLTYLRQENRGLPAARNTAIRHSSSPLLALLDSDDIWLPNRLADSVSALAALPDAALAYGGITLIDAEGHPGQSFTGTPANAATRIAPQIYTREIHLPCPTVTFRRSAVDQVGLFDETMRATEDRDMWFRIASKYEAVFIPKLIALYRVSPQSMSTDPDRMLRAQLQFIRKHYGSPGTTFRLRQIALARAFRQRAEALRKHGQSWPALASSLRALTLYPFDFSNLRTAASLLRSCF